MLRRNGKQTISLFDSGKFTNAQQVYNSRGTAYGIQRSKRRLRGNGLVLQLKFYSEAGKPFKLIGWSSLDTGDTIP
jgi:hypothetical protein